MRNESATGTRVPRIRKARRAREKQRHAVYSERASQRMGALCGDRKIRGRSLILREGNLVRWRQWESKLSLPLSFIYLFSFSFSSVYFVLVGSSVPWHRSGNTLGKSRARACMAQARSVKTEVKFPGSNGITFFARTEVRTKVVKTFFPAFI